MERDTMDQGRLVTVVGLSVGLAWLCAGGLGPAWGQSAEPVEPASVGAVSEAEASMAPRIERSDGGGAVRPVVEPLARPWVQGRETRVGMPAASVDLDPAVLGPPPGVPMPTLHREGDFVVDQLGRLRVLPSGAAAFLFVSEDEVAAGAAAGADGEDALDEPSFVRAMVLQPCQRLETMLSAVEQQDRPALFRLTGQVHVYRGVNYLLPTELTGYRLEDALAEGGDEAVEAPVESARLPDAESDLDAPQVVEVGVETAVEGLDSQAVMDAMAEELAELTGEESSAQPGGGFGGISAPLDRRRVREVPGEPASGVRGGPDASGALVREGTFVMSRAGRLVRSSDSRQVLFAFESDGPALSEPPMAVLPSRLREWMENAVTKRGDAAVFVVSGRVYQFRGANYLLPSVVKLQVGDANLGG